MDRRIYISDGALEKKGADYFRNVYDCLNELVESSGTYRDGLCITEDIMGNIYISEDVDEDIFIEADELIDEMEVE